MKCPKLGFPTLLQYLGRGVGVHFDPWSSLFGGGPGWRWGRPL